STQDSYADRKTRRSMDRIRPIFRRVSDLPRQCSHWRGAEWALDRLRGPARRILPFGPARVELRINNDSPDGLSRRRGPSQTCIRRGEENQDDGFDDDPVTALPLL